MRALLAVLLFCASAEALPLSDADADAILGAARRLDPKRAADIPDVSVRVRPLRTEATTTVLSSWPGAGRPIPLPDVPSVDAGVEIRYTYMDQLKEVAAENIRFYPSRGTLTVDGDLGIPLGHRLVVAYHSSAALDSARVVLPAAAMRLSLAAQVFLAAARRDKTLAYACPMHERGRFRTLRVESADGDSRSFFPEDGDIDYMRSLLDSWHECAAQPGMVK